MKTFMDSEIRDIIEKAFDIVKNNTNLSAKDKLEYYIAIRDMMGGYYDVRAGYGPRYAMSGYIQLTGDNEIFALSGIVPGWGDSYDEFYNGSYDPETGTVTYDMDYAGSMQFHIILQ